MNQSLTKTFYSSELTEDEILQNYVRKISKFESVDSNDEKYYARLAQEGDPLARKILVHSNRLLFDIFQ